jgi:flagellar motor switch protein FliN/FliY
MRMSELKPTLAAEFVAACTAGAADAADALGRSLDGKFALGAPEAGAYAAKPPAGFEGPGLVILLTYGSAGLAIGLAESTGLLPPWYATPDATGESKLSTLAQELSMVLAPESLAADKFEAKRVENIAAALAGAKVAPDAALVTLPVTAGPKTGALSLVWPLSEPAAIFSSAAPATPTPATTTAAVQAAAPVAAPAAAKLSKPQVANLAQLPHYSRSLLKINIPISVHLATKRETVQEIVELVPGAIIKFEKGCDELLQMVIGGQLVAEGEAVKVGDKFGFRITSMLPPREHFIKAKRPKAG